MRQAYFDVKVISPFARSYLPLSHLQLYHMADQAKMREYKERITEVDHGDFNPLIFTTAGGMSMRSHIVLKRLGQALVKVSELSISVLVGWLRCRLSFALLRSTLSV